MGAENTRNIKEVQNSPALCYGVLSTDPRKATPLIIDPTTGNVLTGDPDAIIKDMDGQSPSAFNVTSVNQIAVPANPNRVCLVLCNDSDTTIYIGIGESVAANNGIRLNANGGSITISRWGSIFSTGDIHAIHGSAGAKVLSFQELY